MTLNLPPPIVQKTLATKAFHFEDGKVFLWDTPCFMDPIQIQTYYHRLNEHHTGFEVANRIRYYTAKVQSMTGMKIVNQRFGYAETLREKEQLLQLNTGQAELLGLGKFTWVRIDFENELFIGNCISPFAEEFRRFYGAQDHPIDSWLMGCWAGCIESIIGKKSLCLEVLCIGKGDKECQFVVKPLEKWDANDDVFKKLQFLTQEEPDIKELGGSMDTYTKLR